MTQADFIAKLATKHNVTKAQASQMVKGIFETILHELTEGDGVVPTPFGKFMCKKTKARPEREGRNPATGESITIPAKPEGRKIVFTMSKACKEELNS